ncbi:MAG: hypothetical protein JNN05_11125 [Candidatus Omnitrophica bacterium]|nr:hypothetical protein [Candidatus Omnitrophota bacterium]
MRIEFSIPKLIFGNNFDEVDNSHFEEAVTKLYRAIYDMGVVIAPEMIRNAPVSSVHYSKNIPLTDYSTPSMILEELRKIDLNKRLDLNQTDFRNEGHSLRFRTNSFEISFYDKRKDLQKAKTSEKRAIENDNTIQLELFNKFKPKKPFEVLRIEIRLNKQVKIRQILDKLKIPSPLTFSGLFKAHIAQSVLMHYHNEIKKGYSSLSYKPESSRDFISNFKINNPKTKLRKMLQIYAVKRLINELGIREFRETIKHYGIHNWPRIKNDLERHQFSDTAFAPLKTIEKAIRELRPLSLKEYPKSTLT